MVRSGVGAVSSVRTSGGMCSGSYRLRLGVNDTTVLRVVGMGLSAGLEQRVTRRADPEEAPSKPMPEPTPEHPVGHPNVPTQKDTARNSADPQCFSIFQCRFLF